jgi:TIR domain-containing protein/Leucine Rich Repeat (LRR) protein
MNDPTLTSIVELVAREGLATLDLHGRGLKELPPLPYELPTLRRLDLSGNRLKELPADLWRLTHLEALNLAGNRIVTLDANIGSLHALRSLDLSENRLSTLPSELAACTSLERLNLFANQIAQWPAVLLEIISLRWLDLARNRLDRLPDLHSLAKLEVLDLAGNRLSALPAGLATLKELRVLDLSHNQLTSVDGAALPASLEQLILDNNLLTETPASLRGRTRLYARNNPIKDPPESMSESRLRKLVSGGYEPGALYFDAPDQRFDFVVGLKGREAVTGSIDLYFKGFPGTPVSLRLDDDSKIDLSQVGRQAALHIATASKTGVLMFSPTSNNDTVADTCEFAERILNRVPHSVLVQREDIKRGRGYADIFRTAAKTDDESGGVKDTASLLAAVPAATRDSATPGSSVAGAEPVDVAVFCPPQVVRNTVFLLQVFLYPPRTAKEVDRQAKQMDETAELRGTRSLPLDLTFGTRVDLHLEMPGLTVTEPDAVLVWRGSMTPAQFEVGVPADVAAAHVIGRVRIAVAGVPVGTLRFQVGLADEGASPSAPDVQVVRARRYRRAFVSYSSKDRPEVLRRVQAFRIAGLSVFQDILSLDPGERWEKELYHEIDRCDVFLLFWSHAAAASKWVGKEIDYALARKQGDEERPPAIQPVPIEGPPIAPPPAGLEGLHFNDSLLAAIRASETRPQS